MKMIKNSKVKMKIMKIKRNKTIIKMKMIKNSKVKMKIMKIKRSKNKIIEKFINKIFLKTRQEII
jgi:hypothetical protein